VVPRFRRFFFDGEVSGKFEIGFSVESKAAPIVLDEAQFDNFLRKLFSLRVRLGGRRDEKHVPLILAGSELASVYHAASSKKSKITNPLLVRAGAPVVFFETSPSEKISTRFKKIDVHDREVSDVELSHFWVKDSLLSSEIRCWIMSGSKDTKDYRRQLRINLLRLNASRVGLEVLVHGVSRETIKPAPRSEAAENLQYYINYTFPKTFDFSNRLDRERRLLEVACKSAEMFFNDTVGLIDTLRRRLHVRRQVVNKFELSIQNHPVFRRNRNLLIETLVVGDQVMGDKNQASGQIGAMGSNSVAHDNTFNQLWDQRASELDLQTLAQQLNALRTEMLKSAQGPRDFTEIGAIAEAEMEAASGKGATVFKALSRVGTWSVEVAEKIGAEMVVAAIKASLGLG